MRRLTMWISGLVFLSSVGVVASEPVICGDTTKIVYFMSSIDPTKAPVCSGGMTQRVLTKAGDGIPVIQAQIAMYNTNPQRYLKMNGSGLMVVMSQAEKDAVDLALVNTNPLKPYIDDIAGNNLCDTATLATVQSRIDTVKGQIDTSIAGVTNIPTAQTTLTVMNNAYAAALSKIARCIVDRRFVQ